MRIRTSSELELSPLVEAVSLSSSLAASSSCCSCCWVPSLWRQTGQVECLCSGLITMRMEGNEENEKRKMRADLLPPREPLLKASKVATVKTGGITAWQQNLHNRVSKSLAESLKVTWSPVLKGSRQTGQLPPSSFSTSFFSKAYLGGQDREPGRVQEWESTSLSVGGIGGTPPSCPSSP